MNDSVCMYLTANDPVTLEVAFYFFIRDWGQSSSFLLICGIGDSDMRLASRPNLFLL